MVSVLAVLSVLPIALAAWTGNINYGSPSHHHPGLGVSIRKVAKRQAPSAPPISADRLNFTHGVASGDPLPDSVILWTRASPIMADDPSNETVSGYVPLYNHDAEEYVQVSTSPVCVDYKVSTSQVLDSPAASGRAFTSSDVDYTIKVTKRSLTYVLCPTNSSNRSRLQA